MTAAGNPYREPPPSQAAALLGIVNRPAPPVLYHYTGVGGLDGILRTKSIWASMLHYLNDAQEFRHAISIAEQILAERANDVGPGDTSLMLRAASRSMRRLANVGICVFSLTERADLLSQWRGYCPPEGGYSIGFNTGELVRQAAAHDFYLAPCVYDESEQWGLLHAVVDHVVQAFESAPRDATVDLDERVDAILPTFFYFLGAVAPTIKHASFEEEREWRLISSRVDAASEHLQFRPGRGLLIPYFKLPLTHSEVRPLFGEFYVGPSAIQGLAMQSLSDFLAKQGILSRAVEPSAIPFRNL